jgi:DNA-binding MurR/RpiR family transcriptional regulator
MVQVDAAVADRLLCSGVIAVDPAVLHWLVKGGILLHGDRTTVSSRNRSLEALIRSKVDTFSKGEKVIAGYFLEELNDVAFLSIHDISRKLKVGESSIVRFARKLGYKGFLELKHDIKTHLKSSIAPRERFRLTINGASSQEHSVHRIAEYEVNNINYVVNHFDEGSFRKAVAILSHANIVYSTGYNLSSFLAGITSYLLERIGMKSVPTNLGGRALDEQLIAMKSHDALIAFSLPPYSPQTIKAAKFAKTLKCRVIAFTDSLSSPVVPYADVVLRVKSESGIFTNSISSTLLTLYVLVHELAIRDKARFKQTGDKMKLLSE